MASYDKKTAGVLMTLSGLAYLDSGKSISDIRGKLETALKRKDYATAARWQLVWGPVVHGEGDNLMYLAYSADRQAYAVVLRGTVEEAGSVWEDLPIGQDPFPYCQSNSAKVSSHFLSAMNALLNTRDARAQTTLGEYLAARAKGASVYITGHSQGAALVSMFLAWLLDMNHTLGLRLSVAGYGFAPPTAGNPEFAQCISETNVYFAVVNPLDVVPFGYAGIGELITKRIPEIVPEDLRLVIEGAADEVALVGDWKHPEQVIALMRVQLPDSIGYIDQVLAQHNHNSYLYLLGAPQTDGSHSILPNYRNQSLNARRGTAESAR